MEPETALFLNIKLKGGFVCHALKVGDYETAVRVSLALKDAGHKVRLVCGRSSYDEHDIDLNKVVLKKKEHGGGQ